MHDETLLAFNTQQLTYLREVERAGTLTAAAEALDVSQPALSQSLADLERRAGVRLFERSGRRRVFTEAGVAVARFASEVLGRSAELQAWLDAHRAGEAGTLTVGMIDAASLYVLPSAIQAFRQRYPDVHLRLHVQTSGALLEGLRRFELDLAFIIAPAPDEFDALEVLTEPLRIYGPPADAGAGGIPPAAAEWALYAAGSHTRALIDAGLHEQHIEPRVTFESHNPEILRQVVALGLAWTVLPRAVAEDGSPSLVAQRGPVVTQRTLAAVRRAGGARDARAQAFLDLALEAVEAASEG